MTAKSSHLRTSFLNCALRGVPYTPPAGVYMALYTSAPTYVGGGVEVSGGSYARQVVSFTAPTPEGVCYNSNDVFFPTATANWGNVRHYGLFDALVGGNLLYEAALVEPEAITTTKQFKVPAGQLKVSES